MFRLHNLYELHKTREGVGPAVLREHMREFEALTAVVMKIHVFWNMTPCRLVASFQHFEEL
jgi:hypothetical protein